MLEFNRNRFNGAAAAVTFATLSAVGLRPATLDAAEKPGEPKQNTTLTTTSKSNTPAVWKKSDPFGATVTDLSAACSSAGVTYLSGNELRFLSVDGKTNWKVGNINFTKDGISSRTYRALAISSDLVVVCSEVTEVKSSALRGYGLSYFNARNGQKLGAHLLSAKDLSVGKLDDSPKTQEVFTPPTLVENKSGVYLLCDNGILQIDPKSYTAKVLATMDQTNGSVISDWAFVDSGIYARVATPDSAGKILKVDGGSGKLIESGIRPKKNVTFLSSVGNTDLVVCYLEAGQSAVESDSSVVRLDPVTTKEVWRFSAGKLATTLPIEVSDSRIVLQSSVYSGGQNSKSDKLFIIEKDTGRLLTQMDCLSNGVQYYRQLFNVNGNLYLLSRTTANGSSTLDLVPLDKLENPTSTSSKAVIPLGNIADGYVEFCGQNPSGVLIHIKGKKNFKNGLIGLNLGNPSANNAR